MSAMYESVVRALNHHWQVQPFAIFVSTAHTLLVDLQVDNRLDSCMDMSLLQAPSRQVIGITL